MEPSSERWRQVTTSQYAWEADALNVLRELLPDAPPFQAWTNFQFTDGGRIHEVDGLVITPRPLHGGAWRAYADHRMATAGAIIGLVVEGVSVDDIGSTTKTIPDFPGMWAAMLSLPGTR